METLMADEAHERVHVDADPARCYEVAVAFEDYPSWAGDVLDAVVLWRDATGQARRVQYRAAALGRTIVYVLDYDFSDAPRSFSWTLVTGEMLRALDGRYEFEADGTGTRVGYDLSVDLAVPLPGLLKRRASALIVGTALRDLKRAAEARPITDPTPVPETRTIVPPSPDEPSLPETPAPHPDAVDFAAAGAEERTLPAPSVLECIVSELLGAVPEVRDHVLEAADALLDAAKTLLDVADRVVRQQRGES
jgi:Polyketide cyclase / dehydrase and lipid transport